MAYIKTNKDFILLMKNELEQAETIKLDNKKIGNINLRKNNSLYSNIDIKFKEVLNYEELTISYSILVNGIEIGQAEKDSKYGPILYFKFKSNYAIFDFNEGNYSLDSLEIKIKDIISEIQTFIALFD